MPRPSHPWLMTGMLVLAWGLAFTATHWPTTPGESSLPFPHADKVVHAAIYALLAVTALAAAAAWKFGWSTRLLFGVWAALTVVGLVDEATQLLVQGRDASLADWVADSAGALAGIGFYTMVRAWAQNRRAASSPGITAQRESARRHEPI